MQSRIRAAPAHQGLERARLLQLAFVKHLGTASVLARRSVVSFRREDAESRQGRGSRPNP